MRADARQGAVGDHTQTHAVPTTLSASAAWSEIAEGKTSVEAAAGKPVLLFRPPSDDWDAAIDTMVREQGMLSVGYTVDPRLSTRRAEAEAAWERQAAEAARSNDRAATIAGARRLRLAALHRETRAAIELEWRNALGAVFPAGATVQLGEPPDFVALGGGSSVTLAAKAHAEALVAAAAFAVAGTAYEAVSAELAATTRRLRAIERRWIPSTKLRSARSSSRSIRTSSRTRSGCAGC